MDNNGWPDPARPGVPLNPERDGWHWLLAMYYDDPIGPPISCFWYAEHQSWPRLQDKPGNQPVSRGFCYLGPAFTPAEVDARVSEARRVALEKCILICDAVARANRVEYPEKWKDRPEGIPHEWQRSWETCAETAEDIAAEIRALGEKQ